MVLLAAAVCTKAGKPLLSRQFVEMTRARIEGLLAAFPKLMVTDKTHTAQKQHTFVETESVRYVYQPLDQVYMLLITTKASNILEDLETLRLFSRVIPEYCKTIEEKEILENSFNLIFAFDEVVALGYRENVNLAQIRTYTDMESHEEKVWLEIKRSQEREAKDKAKEKAKELAAARKMAEKRGGGRSPAGGMAGGFGPQGMLHTPALADMPPDIKPTYTAPASRSTGPSKAMRLGGKTQNIDTFVDQLKSEGQDVAAAVKSGGLKAANVINSVAQSGVKMESIHLRAEEKMSLVMTRDGGVESLDVRGLLTLRIADEKYRRVKIKIDNNDKRGAKLQTHPNLDSRAFQAESILALKDAANKQLPLNNDIGVLKWSLATTDDGFVPLSINCWPNESAQGCEVNIEYTLEMDELTLNDVVISIPLPSGSTPVISECEGEYKHERAKNLLEWRLPLIDAANKTGSLEFSTNTGHADNFFPVKIQFASTQQYCDIKPNDVVQANDNSAVKFSSETAFFTERVATIRENLEVLVNQPFPRKSVKRAEFLSNKIVLGISPH